MSMRLSDVGNVSNWGGIITDSDVVLGEENVSIDIAGFINLFPG